MYVLYLYFCVSFGIGGDMTQNDFFGTEGTASCGLAWCLKFLSSQM